MRLSRPAGNGDRRFAGFAVDFGVDDAVEGHGHAARGDHAQDDEYELADVGPVTAFQSAPGEERGDQRERQSEDRVDQLDHFDPNTDGGQRRIHECGSAAPGSLALARRSFQRVFRVCGTSMRSSNLPTTKSTRSSTDFGSM